MICLEEFYEKTGFSRSFLGEVVGVSPDSLKKYEWSNIDHMRQSTIDKIETGVTAILNAGVHVHVYPPHYFWSSSPEWVVTWNDGKYRGTSMGITEMVRGIAGLL